MEAVRDNLKFSLVAWPETGVRCDFVLPPAALSSFLGPDLFEPGSDASPPPRLTTSVRGHFDLQLIGRRLKVKGIFAVKAELTCSRCLTVFAGKVGDSIDETVDLLDEGVGADDQWEGFVAVSNGRFDLTPFLGELFWLSWPVKALCRPDCAGLCPVCGANLNEAPCRCRGETTRH
ncbi:MAG: DUF177 domain-containing protein [Deltaproteobacteria bacterium]|nr:DUF177 domain-containing protein [Deltaproteobacteria bacterium]